MVNDPKNFMRIFCDKPSLIYFTKESPKIRGQTPIPEPL